MLHHGIRRYFDSNSSCDIKPVMLSLHLFMCTPEFLDWWLRSNQNTKIRTHKNGIQILHFFKFFTRVCLFYPHFSILFSFELCLHWIACVSTKFHFSSKLFSVYDDDLGCFSVCSELFSKTMFTFSLQFSHLFTSFLHIFTDSTISVRGYVNIGEALLARILNLKQLSCHHFRC